MIQNLSVMDLQQSEEQWAKLQRPGAVDAVKVRLGALSAWLDGRDSLPHPWEDGGFSEQAGGPSILVSSAVEAMTWRAGD